MTRVTVRTLTAGEFAATVEDVSSDDIYTWVRDDRGVVWKIRTDNIVWQPATTLEEEQSDADEAPPSKEEATVTEIADDKQLSYAEKIDKLLRKAENTTSPDEADAFVAKAQELMIKFAIDEELLAQLRGEARVEEIVQKSIKYTGIHQSTLMGIGSAVARNNDCRTVFSNISWQRPTHHLLTITGFEGDVDRVLMLDASLQIQAASALNAWLRVNKKEYWTKMDRFKAQRDFLSGFGQGVYSKLRAARQAGIRAAADDQAGRETQHATDADKATAAKASVELVLQSKERRVQDWYDKKYGRSLRTVHRNYQSSGTDARSHGYTAGRQADTGQPKVGGRNRQIGR